MKTRSMFLTGFITGGVLAALVVAVVLVYNWPRVHHPVSKPSASGSNVVIQVSADNSANEAKGEQVYATVQQILNSSAPSSFDASGFVQYVYGTVGVKLPRTVADQSQVGTAIDVPADLTKGDLVFFDLEGGKGTPTFDGVYLGDNQFAALTTHGLKVMNLSDTYWAGKFIYGRRVL